MDQRVGIVIIGNEVLAGKVVDENGPYLCKQLWMVGREVGRISTIPDVIDDIARTVAEHAERFSFVITTGGIGPTHDDVTIAGVARAFGVSVVRNKDLQRVLRSHFHSRLTPAIEKMADLPAGTDLLYDDDIPWPILRFRNVFIFPGIPRLLRSRFVTIRERFRATPILSRHLYLRLAEEQIADLLLAFDATHPRIRLGSYPIVDQLDYQVVITLESRSRRELESGQAELVALLPADAIHRIDDAADAI
jgi:molybdenum cofactor synthesis domain-containing protein